MKWFVFGLIAVSFIYICYVAVELHRVERLRGGK